MFALKGPVQPGGGKGLPYSKDTTFSFLDLANPPAVVSPATFFELPRGKERALLEKKIRKCHS